MIAPNPVLDACLDRIRPLPAVDQLAALNRLLGRRAALKEGLAGVLASLSTGEALVAAMARPEDGARALALVILAELDPGSAQPLLAEANRVFDREQARCF